ncbi:hypothetical protein FBQ83_14980 [Chloroflexi bacterium CFX5]|nr:hypothetical protein [Chloroflexi bacterium CFX5]
MNGKTHVVGVWMAFGALVGSFIGAVIGILSDDWSWIAYGIPIGVAVGFGIGAAKALGVHAKNDKNATDNKN